jgi:hypothetical protein
MHCYRDDIGTSHFICKDRLDHRSISKMIMLYKANLFFVFWVIL